MLRSSEQTACLGDCSREGTSQFPSFYCSHVLAVVQQVCTHLLILRKGIVLAYDTTETIHNDVQNSSLERTFMHLVEEVNTDRVTGDIISAMEMS